MFVQLEGKVQSRMDVALRDWVGRVTPAAKLLGRNHTEPYTWRPFSNVSEVGCPSADRSFGRSFPAPSVLISKCDSQGTTSVH